MSYSVFEYPNMGEVKYTSPRICVLVAESTSPLLDSPEGGFEGDEGWMDEEEL